MSDDQLQAASVPAAAPPLVVLLDYDNCLKTVMNAWDNVQKYGWLINLVARLVHSAGVKASTKAVVLLSYSNRVSDDYNKFIQSKLGARPTIDAINKFAQMLAEHDLFRESGWSFKPRHGRQDGAFDGYLIDGNAAFKTKFDENWKDKAEEVKTAISTTTFGRELKMMLYRAARADNPPESPFLVFDDKWENLEAPLRDSLLHTRVVHLDAGKLSGTFNCDKSRKRTVEDWSPDDFWNKIVDKENWWASAALGGGWFGELCLE